MKTNYQEKVAKNAQKNYDIFIQGELKTSKEDIIANAYKISFYNAMLDFLIEEDSGLEDGIFELLYGFDDYVLDVLYSEYLDCENSSINTFGDICEFLLLIEKNRNAENSNENKALKCNEVTNEL